jgi:hypothetical protein
MLPSYGAPDCPVCHRIVSGAPGRSTLNCSASGFWKCHSAIIHWTVRCCIGLSGAAPDCPVCQAEQRLLRQRSSAKGEQYVNSARTVRAEVRAAPEGAPDSEK